MGKPEPGEGCCDRLSSAHGGALGRVNSQQLVVTCVDHASLTEELVAADGCWRRENHFSLAMWPLVGCHALEDDPTLVGTWAALLGFSGFLGFGFKEKGEDMKMGGAVLGGVGGLERGVEGR